MGWMKEKVGFSVFVGLNFGNVCCDSIPVQRKRPLTASLGHNLQNGTEQSLTMDRWICRTWNQIWELDNKHCALIRAGDGRKDATFV